jgi:hypothetical protein
MQRRITGFRLDGAELWIADLECGHTQHVRHKPPWEIRPWILTEELRHTKIGTTLNCPICRLPFISPPSLT